LTGLSPRHRQAPPAEASNLSPIHSVNSVTYLSGPYKVGTISRGAGEGLETTIRSGRSFPFDAPKAWTIGL
jgi:hypothetical protein